jgi:hypothetical protein
LRLLLLLLLLHRRLFCLQALLLDVPCECMQQLPNLLATPMKTLLLLSLLSLLLLLW